VRSRVVVAVPDLVTQLLEFVRQKTE